MAEQWISAREANDLCGNSYAICERLYAGLIESRAQLILIDQERFEEKKLPSKFWWACGQAALDQNWDTGDFSTWIDRDKHWRAFGVRLSLAGILDMLPSEQRAATSRRLSIAGAPGWISAQGFRQAAYSEGGVNPMRAGAKVMELARLGFVDARAVLAQATQRGDADDWLWERREWDIPAWFWNNFTGTGASAQDWELGKFSGGGSGPGGINYMTLSGVHFTKDSLIAFRPNELTVETHDKLRIGRRPKWNWAEATSAVWGKLHRGELIPSVQADVEKALISLLRQGDIAPDESTVRPFARQIWEEFGKP